MRRSLNPDRINPDESLSSGADELLYLSRYIKRKVVNKSGIEIGIIKDVLFSNKNRNIEYVILKNNSGFLKKYSILPSRLFQYSGPGEPLICTATEKCLKQAPKFEKVQMHEVFTRHYDLIVSFWNANFN